ncbi:PEP-CTERM sorting domain-containing protein [Photobacterium japonica]|uniref:PEP-CTERM sorting domain-containing protein n=1 Tax=Photobacterium japonica TaxID=2910235 RepID=UPI003D0E11D9
MIKQIALTALCVGSFAFAGLTQAAVMYDVINATSKNCKGGPHGLWTNKHKFSGGKCGQYFGIQSGKFTFYNDHSDQNQWTATLNMLAKNPTGDWAEVNINFEDFSHKEAYKRGGGGRDNSPTDLNTTPEVGNGDIDFFTGIGAGSYIKITKKNSAVKMFDYLSLFGTKKGKPLVFQFGDGASDKRMNNSAPLVFGGAAWLLPYYGAPGKKHWDLNLHFVEPTVFTVPAPSSLGMFGAGALALAFWRRRQTQS